MKKMMNQEESENGFELVDRPKEGSVHDGPVPLPTWLPQPSLPANVLATAGATPVILPLPEEPFSTRSIPAPVPLVLPELSLPFVTSKVADNQMDQKTSTPSDLGNTEGTLASDPSVSTVQDKNLPQPSGNSGIFSWVKDALPTKQIFAKVAEKARSSMDYAITTLDPQMKEIINSGGSIDITVLSNKEVKISPVREAFQCVFGKATIRGSEFPFGENSNIAAQPVGFNNAILAAEERISHARSQGSIDSNQTAVSVEGFAVELFPENWFEMNCLVLEDPVKKIRLQAFSQPLMIPTGVVEKMRNQTPASYAQRLTGFAVTVGQTVSEEFKVIFYFMSY